MHHNKIRGWFRGAALSAALAVPLAAAAQQAFTTELLNLRAGPGIEYPVVAVLSQGQSLDVMGCQNGYDWCDVVLPDGERGWVAASFLQFPYQGAPVPLTSYAPAIGVPIITFGLGAYWGSYYRDRPWYNEPRWWHGRPPPPPMPGWRPPPPPRPGWQPHPPPHDWRPPPPRPGGWDGRPGPRPDGHPPSWNPGPRPDGRPPGWNGGPRPDGRPQDWHGGPRPDGRPPGPNPGSRPEGRPPGGNPGPRPDRPDGHPGARPDRTDFHPPGAAGPRPDRPNGPPPGWNRHGGGGGGGGDHPQARPPGGGGGGGGDGGRHSGRGGPDHRGNQDRHN